MSPRAAWRLESLGFREVYDYRPGKSDWLAAGLPSEGPEAAKPRLAAHLRADVPTCAPGDRLGDVSARVRAAGWTTCLVVNEERILFGRLDTRELAGDPDVTAEQAMRPGASTYRPDVAVGELRHTMRHRGITVVPVTTSDGVLLGVVTSEMLEQVELP